MNFQEYFQNKNLKKTPKVGIHFEQKTTPDLLWCVALVILDFIKEDKNIVFSDKENIRKSPVFNALMQDYFSKPPQEKAENEYNKVSSYQLGLLTYAGVLDQVSNRPKKYKVRNLDVLKFISINDLNASKFLAEYTNKFLQDNNLLEVFDKYKQTPNQDNHLRAKEAYWKWAKKNTAIKGTDRKHTYRVFNKIFNMFCYKNRIPGEDASNITSGPCPYSFLIYNRENFRDKDMPLGMTRHQYQLEVLSEINEGGVVATLLQKAKDSVRQKYQNSEILAPELGYIANSGIHVHHILPQHSYPEFSLAKENLIALTPGQHLSFAHVQANTKSINQHYQAICLKTKLKNIKISLDNNESFYNYKDFISVINTCYGWNLKIDTPMNILLEKIEQKIQELI
ncbi:MAG: hypothetical protein HYV76_00800 [Candidatus Vogelbacteria bacterium]|nr:hypothetical protein [Candidatus Vogelbacteria bacterium]